jgi:RimJ/RimL family protein N-acetyltransferase
VRWTDLAPGDELTTRRLHLVPLTVDAAGEMATVLADPRLYRFTGGSPLGADDLRERYERQVAGRSPDGTEAWFNWIIRLTATDRAVGYVQASVACQPGAGADVAWVVAVAHQGQGIATEAVSAMVGWFQRTAGLNRFRASIHSENLPSIRLAERLGFIPTDSVDADGERTWVLCLAATGDP